MNEYQREWFFSEITKNKGSQSEVVKDDVVNFALECGLEFKKSISKEKIIQMIRREGFEERMYKEFSEFFYVPVWEVARIYKISTQKIAALTELEVIKENPVECEYSGRSGKFKAMAYPIEVLAYEPSYLLGEYDKAFTKDVFRMRLETKTEEEVKELIILLSKVFEVVQAPQSYEHRSEKGYYSYFNVRPIQNNQVAEKRLVQTNAELQTEIARLNKELNNKQHQLRECYEQIRKYDMDIRFSDQYIELSEKIKKIDHERILVKNENAKLKNEILEYQNKEKSNSRGAGRKPKFSDEEVEAMKVMKEQGESYSSIAKKFNTTKGTVIKYLVHR